MGGGAARCDPTRGVLRGGHRHRKGVATGTIGGMRSILLVLGVLLIGAGAAFVAQGLDLPFAPGSFMTADRTWVLIGAIVVVAGVVLVGWSRQRDPSA